MYESYLSYLLLNAIQRGYSLEAKVAHLCVCVYAHYVQLEIIEVLVVETMPYAALAL